MIDKLKHELKKQTHAEWGKNKRSKIKDNKPGKMNKKQMQKQKSNKQTNKTLNKQIEKNRETKKVKLKLFKLICM